MATKDKAQKKAKLRHTEYYDFQEIQDKLYADSLKGPQAQMAERSGTWKNFRTKN